MAYSPKRTADALINQNLDAIAKELADPAPPAAILIDPSAFTGGWKRAPNLQAPGYRCWPTGEVELFGGMTAGATGAAAFKIPFAPKASRQWATSGWSGSAPVAAFIKVDSLGSVIPYTNTNNLLFLDGVRFVNGG